MMMNRVRYSLLTLAAALLLLAVAVSCQKAKKDVAELSDADLERIYEQWEENDEEKLPDDEKEPHLRPPPAMNIDLDSLKGKSPEQMKMLGKKGKPVMIFVTLAGKPSRRETDELTAIWQTSLFNANFEVTRYIAEDDRAIYMVQDGSRAYEVKDFLVKQERCLEVTIDNERFEGEHPSLGAYLTGEAKSDL